MLFAAVDPGARHVAACMLRRDTRGLLLIHALSLDVDLSDLASVRAVVARVVDFADVGIVAAGIETVRTVHGVQRGSENAMGAAYAQGLAGSNLVAGRLAQALEAEEIDVHTPSREDVRRALCGSASADDRAVKAAVRLRVRGWPAKSNAHQRDAALCAVWTAETWAARRRERGGR